MLAIYIRVSTALQAERGTSLATQEEQCLKKAREEGFESWEIYADEGYSGMDLDRPAITRLREDIVKGRVHALICWDVDRLARGTVYQLLILEEIRKYRVQLVFVNTTWQDTPEGRLLFQMQSIIAEYELAKIKLRTTWGRMRCAKDGKIMPMRYPPYGYNYDSSEGTLKVNSKEAAYVQKVYRWYIYEHLSMRAIGRRLAELGVPAKAGGHWSASSVKRILESPVYTGTFYYNRRESRVKEGAGRTKGGYKRRQISERAREDWIEIKVPALVTSELYEKARNQAEAKRGSQKGNNKFPYLFKGMLRCAHCGRIWQATLTTGGSNSNKISYPLYRCPGKNPIIFGVAVEKCPSRSLNGRYLDEFLWRIISEIVANPKSIAQLLKTHGLGLHGLEVELDEVNSALIRAEVEKKKVLRLYRQELLTEAETNLTLAELKQVLKRQEAKKQRLCQAITERKVWFAKGGVDVLARRLAQLVGSELNHRQKRELVELLVTEVLVETVIEGKVLLRLKGPIELLEQWTQSQDVVNIVQETLKGFFYFAKFVYPWKPMCDKIYFVRYFCDWSGVLIGTC